ncbi:MFS transporter [Saccharothrix variisporea]|uniref:Transmembrane secretion effector n=1 Tax=Saccharothrix variisporea TaxID=543527 RepID=A0A495XNE0_9PSEU|nr:MFS transporter [Saccharothrix variisporea]RKT74434.1 transmembrane secretion effector [Saccharothrix variisporea]
MGENASLWHDRTFLTAWVAHSTSTIGTAVTSLALPIVAVTALDASTFEIGILRALTTIAFLFLALPAGVLVDRRRKRPLLLWCDAIRAAVLVTVPVAFLLGGTSISHLYVVAFVVGAASVLSGIAFDSFRTALVPPPLRGEANARIAATDSFARVSGPGFGAGLVAWVGAALAVLVDVLSYLLSFVLLTRVKNVAEPQSRAGGRRRGVLADIREGFAFVRSDPTLSRIVACTAIGNFSLFASGAVTVVFLIRDLGLAPGLVGLVFCLGESGGLLAAFLAPRLTRSIGSARIILVSAVCAPVGYLALFSTPDTVFPVFGAFMIASSARYVLYDIAQYTYRQSICPPDLLGRMNASIRWVVGSASPVGAVVGGWLGLVVGPRTTLGIATTVLIAGSLLLIASPLRRARDIAEIRQPEAAG